MNVLKKIFEFEPSAKEDGFRLSLEDNADYDVRDEKKITKTYVTGDYDKDFAYIRKRFQVPLNNDVVMRELVLENGVRAFIVFYDGMSHSQYMNDNVITPLLKLPHIEGGDFTEELYKEFTTHNQASMKKDMDDIIDEVNFGACGLFVEGVATGFVFDVRFWEHRGISKPENEQSIYGPQEAFAEMLRTNTALVRKILKTEKLVAQGVKVGTVSKTRGVLLYLDGVANDKLVSEAKRRIDAIGKEYIISIEQVQMLVEDRRFMITPQTYATERPDRTARALSEGRCVLLLNGSPRALIMPSNAFELTHTASDEYLHVPFALMSRIIRIFGMFVSLLLPALYLAITLYHQEVLPTYLLYSISASRENVPFPSLLELLLMNVSFELIREAGIRMPSPIGSTLGIVGGLILGQAAVSAKIVSPIMIIIIAITGIGSFATSDYTLGWTYRILRIAFIIFAATLGLYGIAIGIVAYGIYLGSAKSFGISFLSPPLRAKGKSMSMAILLNGIAKRERRPGFLQTKESDSEPEISRKWSTFNKRE